MKNGKVIKRICAYILAVALIMSIENIVFADNFGVYIPADNSVKITDVICKADEVRSEIYHVNVRGEFNSVYEAKDKIAVTMLTYVKKDNALSVTDKGYDDYQDEGDMQIVGIDMIDKKGNDRTFDFYFTVTTLKQDGVIVVDPGQAAIVLVGGDGLNPGAALFKIDTEKESRIADSVSVVCNEIVDVYSYYNETEFIESLKKSFKTTSATLSDAEGNKLGTTNIISDYIVSAVKKDDTTYLVTANVPQTAMTFGEIYDIKIPEDGLSATFDVKTKLNAWDADTVAYKFETVEKIPVSAVLSENDLKAFFVGKTVDVSMSGEERSKETVAVTDSMITPAENNPAEYHVGNVFSYIITIPDTQAYKIPDIKNKINVSVEIVEDPPKPFTITETELIGDVSASYTGEVGELKSEVIERVIADLKANTALKVTVKGDGGRVETWKIKSNTWTYAEDKDGKSVFSAEIESEDDTQLGVNSNNLKVYAETEIILTKYMFSGDAFTYDFTKVSSDEVASGDIKSQYGRISVKRNSTGGQVTTSIEGNALKIQAKPANGYPAPTIDILPDEFNEYNKKMITTLKFKNTYTDMNGNVIESSKDTAGVCFVDLGAIGVRSNGNLAYQSGAFFKSGKTWGNGTKSQHGVTHFSLAVGQIPTPDADGFYSLRLESYKDESGVQHTDVYGEGCTQPIVKNVYCDSTSGVYGEKLGYGARINISFTSKESAIHTVWIKDVDIRYETDKGVYKFVDDDGTVLKKEFVDYRTAVVAPESPIKENTAQYSYEFAGFDGYADGMTLNEYANIFKATYKTTVNNYTYKFLNEDGSVIKEENVPYGTVIVAPEDPTKSGNEQYNYIFDGWEGFTEGMTVEGNATFTAKFKTIANEYTYKFLNEEGTVLSEKTVPYGTAVTLPATNPVKESDAQYTYTFVGWEGFTDGMTVTGDITFTAKFDKTVNKYTYKFLNEDGTLISEKTVNYGTVIEKPENPTKQNNAQHTYVFVGWEGFTDGMTVTGDATFTAKFSSTSNSYTYKFVNEDGAVIEEKTVPYGTAITLPATNPVKESDAQYTYTFAGWDGFADGMTVTGNVSFTARFDKTINSYTYKFLNEDGTVMSEKTVPYGTAITLPDTNPTKESTVEYTYTFAGWEGFIDGMTVTGNVSFTAKFDATVNEEPLFAEVTKTATGYNFDILLNKAKVNEFADGKYVVAFYDENGRLAHLLMVDAPYDNTNFDVEVSVNAKTVKLMLWKDLLTPLCKETEIRL